MEQRLKQRLVGAGVLVALAVLLLPLWLDGEGIKSLSVEEIPPEPTIIEPTTPPELPSPGSAELALLDNPPPPPVAPTTDDAEAEPELTAEKSSVAPAPKMGNTSANPPPEQPKSSAMTQPASPPASTTTSRPTASPSGNGWVVQLGSFSDELNARALQESVRQAGFNAFLQPLFAERGTVWRVRVGPFETRQEALQQRARLRERLNRDGIVVAH